MEKVIDVRSGEFPSLAENEDFALVFRGLAMGGAINASIIAGDYSSAGSLVDNGQAVVYGSNTDGRVVVSKSVSGSDSEADDIVVLDTGVSLLKPFELAGMGVGFEDGRNFTVVALLHGTASAAEENIPLLRNRVDQAEYADGKSWSEQISALEINTYGRLLVARLFHDSKNVNLLDPNGLPRLILHEP